METNQSVERARGKGIALCAMFMCMFDRQQELNGPTDNMEHAMMLAKMSDDLTEGEFIMVLEFLKGLGLVKLHQYPALELRPRMMGALRETRQRIIQELPEFGQLFGDSSNLH